MLPPLAHRRRSAPARARVILAPASLLLVTSCLALTATPSPWPCDSHSDCEGEQVCLVANGSSQGYCKTLPCGPNRPCGADSFCSNGTCVKKQCTHESSTCAPYICNGNFTCEKRCGTSLDCIQGFACSEGACIGAQCTGTTDSRCGGYACEGGLCLTSCLSDFGCDQGLECVSRRCQPKCDGQTCTGGSGGSGASFGAGGGEAFGAGGGALFGGTGGAAGSPAAGSGGAGAAPACNPVTKKGCTNTGDKCSVVPGKAGLYAHCEKEGPVGLESPCERLVEGRDNCQEGLFCTDYGVPSYEPFSTDFVCKKFCSTDANCPIDTFCAALSSDGFGVCVETCVPFASCFGIDINTVCSRLYRENQGSELRLGCRLPGAGKEGDGCHSDQGCKVDHACVDLPVNPPSFLGTCVKLCDASHPCPAGKTCVSDAGACPAGQVCLCL